MNDIIRQASMVKPSRKQLEWQRMELTAFLHFTVNTFTNKEWGDGKENPAVFDPKECDPRQWAMILAQTGFKMAILTAKHHDGFCLWPSKYTEHTIKNSPWQNGEGDLVKEFCNACREYGIKPGLYVSPWDRHEKTYGDSEKYNIFFKNQLRELLTNYGDITCFWFDGACGEGANGKRQIYDWQGYYDLIYSIQPNALISNCGPDIRWAGNEAGKKRPEEWSVINLDKSIYDYNHQNCKLPDLGSAKALGDGSNLIWWPAEYDTSIRPGWFYHSHDDDKVKSLKQLVDIYFNSVGNNGVLLLNIPPDKNGILHKNDCQRLNEFKNFFDKAFEDYNAEFVKKYENTKDTVLIEFCKDIKFNCISLQEDISQGQHVADFFIEIFTSEGWQEIYSGKTIGYKKLIRLKEIESSKIRITFSNTRGDLLLLQPAFYNIPELIEDLSCKNDKFLETDKWEIISTGSQKTTKRLKDIFKQKSNKNCSSNFKLPLELTVSLNEMKCIKAFCLQPPENSNKGHVYDYEFLTSMDGKIWTMTAKGQLQNTVNNPIMQRIEFLPENILFFKFKPLSSFDGGNICTFNQFSLIEN